MRYPVNEIFESIQGEAMHTGRPSVFIRLQGCDVGCAWCDTKHTWAVRLEEERPKAIVLTKVEDGATYAYMTEFEIVRHVKDSFSAKHIVITGGEPCQYDLRPLTSLFLAIGYNTVQVETSGTEDVMVDARTWVTVSPKIGMPGKKAVRKSALHRADEIKHPVAIERNVTELLDLIETHGLRDQSVPVWLQPVWQSERSRGICIASCIKHGFRMSVQTHKILGVR